MEIFDGVAEAKKIEISLRERGSILGKKLVIIQADGKEGESVYVRLKREMGDRLGVVVVVENITGVSEIKKRVEELGNDKNVDGILVQLPILGASDEEVDEVLYSINPDKDVDGLNPKSSFVSAVVMGVEVVMDKLKVSAETAVALVGSEGMVGRRLYERLLELGFVVSGFENGDDLRRVADFGVVISCTGQAGLIAGEMVGEGFVGIDLGFPKGDFSSEAIQKAAKISPVPGGVGPLTVVSLFENLAVTTR